MFDDGSYLGINGCPEYVIKACNELWVLAQGEDIVPIPGTKRLDKLEKNIEATKIRLLAEDLEMIDNIILQGIAREFRYADMSRVNH